jgi:Spy/CpxP family protein refolding chaperone
MFSHAPILAFAEAQMKIVDSLVLSRQNKFSIGSFAKANTFTAMALAALLALSLAAQATPVDADGTHRQTRLQSRIAEQRKQLLHTLQLNPAQAQAFTDFTQQLMQQRAQLQAHRSLLAQRLSGSEGAVDATVGSAKMALWLDQQAHARVQIQASRARLRQSFLALYAQLSPRQQNVLRQHLAQRLAQINALQPLADG